MPFDDRPVARIAQRTHVPKPKISVEELMLLLDLLIADAGNPGISRKLRFVRGRSAAELALSYYCGLQPKAYADVTTAIFGFLEYEGAQKTWPDKLLRALAVYRDLRMILPGNELFIPYAKGFMAEVSDGPGVSDTVDEASMVASRRGRTSSALETAASHFGLSRPSRFRPIEVLKLRRATLHSIPILEIPGLPKPAKLLQAAVPTDFFSVEQVIALGHLHPRTSWR
ncbi:hypothetical protein [Devosia sp.]|uniref:hypothetical protein n=1 Tax=Devosia sp. TaxID=1871048 RepID=UPI0025E76FAF|nr:hypothetical protein [Devosia sp.]MCR6634766.1 hypothetical protein [Devosia sp.]